MSDLRALAEAWMATDPDPDTRAATAAMLDDPEALERCFGARLQFGTAGLRGALGPGPNRMNRALVRRVSAGLAAYVGAQAPGGRVVIGFDGRNGSREFAEDTARVLGEAGLDVMLFDEVCPTPVLAHAVVFVGAAAGVMVTASHNPPEDNGYKVYWSNGAQIVAPHDAGISAAIDAVDTPMGVPELADLRAAGIVREVPPEAHADYLARVKALRVHPDAPTGLRIVYTAMHGVGTATVREVMEDVGYTLTLVAAQAEPDGDFPTVRFPNPEEPGALDLAKALAAEVDADIVVANDPDADRLAVVVPTADGWRQLSGNEVGCLLAEDLLANGPTDRERLVATTIVSSTLLSRIAAAHGAVYAETLTGFKWIANAAIPFDADGGRFVMGYEEALGYSVGDVVRDKDGVSAVLLFCDLAAHLKQRGETVLDALEALYRQHGVHAARQVSLKGPGAEGARRIQALMARLRDKELATLAGRDVVTRTDVLTGTRIDLQTGDLQRVDLPKSNVLAWTLDDGSRVLARPSGTEPKIKFYYEAVVRMADGERLDAAEARAQARVDQLVAAFEQYAGPL
ncbi:MAG: phospho-sugar mutase [Alphaproteobacteria bacterium]|nr:phospho-sugar mutase [Alphaproteobacteria bacterium]